MTLLTIFDFIFNKLPFGFITDGFKTRISSIITATVPVIMALSAVIPGLTDVAIFLESLLPVFASGITWGLVGKEIKKKKRRV